jgi:hypothetical protein
MKAEKDEEQCGPVGNGHFGIPQPDVVREENPHRTPKNYSLYLLF